MIKFEESVNLSEITKTSLSLSQNIGTLCISSVTPYPQRVHTFAIHSSQIPEITHVVVVEVVVPLSPAKVVIVTTSLSWNSHLASRGLGAGVGTGARGSIVLLVCVCMLLRE